MRIYADYGDEPKEHFQPLPEELYRDLYNLEMSSFSDDLEFYKPRLKTNSDILELGCGSGRLTRLLADEGHRVTGIDHSLPMLAEAHSRFGQKATFIAMDMRQLAFHRQFDAIIIPYNTLNLLSDRDDVVRCLNGCHRLLQNGGRIFLHLYVPTEEILSLSAHTTFQFQMLDRPEGGKIIKEVLRKYDAHKHHVHMTERYKIRPMISGQVNSNYSHSMTINAIDQKSWFDLIHSCGFTVTSFTSSCGPDKQPDPSLLLIQAEKTDEKNDLLS
jgi:ubiquinone/menaquinone biosynthesis C-methylase UbiE